MTFKAVKDFIHNGIQYSAGEDFSPAEYLDFNIDLLLNNLYIQKVDNAIYSYEVKKPFIFEGIEYNLGDSLLHIIDNPLIEKLYDHNYVDKIPCQELKKDEETLVAKAEDLEVIKKPIVKPKAKAKPKKKKR